MARLLTKVSLAVKVVISYQLVSISFGTLIMIKQFATLLTAAKYETISAREYSYKHFISVVLTIVLSSLIFSSIAIYNGFPFLISDSVAYIKAPLVGHLEWARPIFYSLFILPLHHRSSLWPIVFAQALLVSHILYLTVRVIRQDLSTQDLGIYVFLCLALLLTALTSLPWLVGWIMTEVFTGVLILCLFLLGFGFCRLSRIEIVYLVILAAATITFHSSHVLISFIVVAAIVVYRAVIVWPKGLRVKQLAMLICPLGLSLAALVSVQAIAYHAVTISYYGSEMLLGKFIASGPIKEYLYSHCPEEHFILCDYVDNLPSSDVSSDTQFFLWDQKSPFYLVGGPHALREEANDLVFKSIIAYPIWYLQISISDTFNQLISFSIDTGLMYADIGRKRIELDQAPLLNLIQTYFPSSFNDFITSKQYMRQLPIQEARMVHKIMIIFSALATIPIVLALMWQRQRLLIALMFSITVGIISNAAVCGTFSTGDGRYQSRVIWLLVFYVLLGIWCVVDRPRLSSHKSA